MPVIWRLPEEKPRPAGRDGDTEYVRAPLPPNASGNVTADNCASLTAEIGAMLVPSGNTGTGRGVALSALAATVSEKVSLAVSEAAVLSSPSDAMNVTAACANVAVGVPDSKPVDSLKLRPAGNAGLNE